MLTVYSEKHRLRNAKTELSGGELVAPFECPERAEHILQRAKDVGLGNILAPDEFGLDALMRVHNSDFLRFLETCWADWQAAGFDGEAIPTIWPSRRMSERGCQGRKT